MLRYLWCAWWLPFALVACSEPLDIKGAGQVAVNGTPYDVAFTVKPAVTATPSPGGGAPSPTPTVTPTPAPSPISTPSTQAPGWPAGSVPASAVSLTLGDTEVAAGIARVTGDKQGAYGWNGPTGYERPGDPEGFWPYAKASRLPDAGRGFLSWRAIVPAYPFDVLIPGDSKFVAIEYKDNLLSPRLDARRPKGDGPTVAIGGIRAGELEARRDHHWKRVLFTVPATARPEADGRLRVRVGGGVYGTNEVYGSALVHRVLAAREAIGARAPVAGFWPASTPLARDGRLYDRAGLPYVPILVGVPHSNADLAQIDVPTLIGANTNFAIGSAEGNGKRGWADTTFTWPDGKHVQRGIAATMRETIARGLFTVPWNYTDTWAYFIPKMGAGMAYGGPGYEALYDGTWRGVVRVWEKALSELVAHNPKVPVIFLKDEWDHESLYWGSTEEQVVELRAVANRIVPGVPTLIATMGWKPLMHRAGYDLADIQATDRYPKYANLQQVAEWAEELRQQAQGRPFLSVLALTNSYESVRDDPAKWNSPAYLRAGTYMSLVHGGRGVWWFGETCGLNTATCADYYRSLKPITDEVKALADVIHGEAKELGRTIASSRLKESHNWYPLKYDAEGDGISLTDGIATTFRESTRRRVLLAINEWNEPLTGHLRVRDLKAGQVVKVLFEDRVIVVETDGQLVDTFQPFARHVYLIGEK